MLRSPKVCRIDGCGKIEKAKGLCAAHYWRLLTYGVPDYPVRPQTRTGAPQAFIALAVAHVGDECLPWPFATNNMGYAQINDRLRGRKRLVSRVVCETVNGPPPSTRHHAAHSCGNGHLGCVSGAHLSWKTAKENAADSLVHGTRSLGDGHASVLTSVDIPEIRSLSGKMSQARIAERFGVSQTMVSKIILRKCWASIP